MWIFTKHGFFSAVCARKGDGMRGQPVDPNRIMIRARVSAHLEALKERFPDRLGKSVILESPEADYAYRLLIPKSDWGQVLLDLAEEIDYDNFKSKVANNPEKVGAAYRDSLHEGWSVMNRLQR